MNKSLGYISLLLICSLASVVNVHAQEAAPAREHKGFVQVDLKVSGVSRSIVQDLGGGIKDSYSVDSTRLFVQASIRPLSVLEVYALGGGADARITDVYENKFYGELGPYFGAGLRLRLYESIQRRALSLFLDGSYSQFVSREPATLKEFEGAGYYNVDEKILWREYGISLLGNWRLAFSGAPEGYLGLRVSWVDGEDSFSGQISRKYDFVQEGLIALLLGTNIFLDSKENIAITIELEIGEPTSLSGGVRLWL